MYDLTIVHIEDEYEDFRSLVSFAAGWLEDYWTENLDQLAMAQTRVVDRCGDERVSWVVNEITVDVQKAHSVKYVFVQTEEVPGDLDDHIYDRRVFIVDVLRAVPGKTTLESTAKKSIASIKRFSPAPEEVVLFTAHQGTGLEHAGSDMPRKISKESQNEIEDFIADALKKCVSDG